MSTWMVVEDEPDIYDVLLAMFEIWGIEGVAFVDGAEAVSWIEDVDQGRVRGELPELAILDIRLPEVDGPTVGQRLRKSPILGNVAIVLITAYRLSPDEEQQVIARAQADLLMYKPLPAMLELRKTMDAVIAKHKKDGSAAAPIDASTAALLSSLSGVVTGAPKTIRSPKKKQPAPEKQKAEEQKADPPDAPEHKSPQNSQS
ncbi:MAG: response regulator transcription factor [Anaerolineae bacterium]|nr:response regulator transcription factor [Anaerolineae bacterium]